MKFIIKIFRMIVIVSTILFTLLTCLQDVDLTTDTFYSKAATIFVSDNSVYVAGSWCDSIPPYYNQIGCYWKDGVRHDIEDKTTNVFTYSLAVSDDSVYVVGSYSLNGKNIRCYWKDGVQYDFGENDFANSVAVLDSSVYFAGNYYDGSIPVACYWNNGVRHDLGDAINLSTISSIAFSGSSIYFSGYYVVNQRSIACYWKDGVRYDLGGETETDKSNAYSIAVSGSNVYVAGYYYDNGTETVACYWINGVRHILEDAEVSDRLSIAVSETSVYILGGYEKHGRINPAFYNGYWKDGVWNTIGNAGDAAGAITISGSSVYIAGYYLKKYSARACYWKDGVRYDLE